MHSRSRLRPVGVSARAVFATAIVAFGAASAAPALAQSVWPSQYKIRPWETDKLTAADVVGPDGIVYPDFTRAGVTGGIPDINNSTVRAGYTVYSVTTYGANGSDTALDDTAVANALSAANANAASGGKSILYFPAGAYRLSQPLTVTGSRVVIDGDGPASTKILLAPGGFTRPGSINSLTPIAGFNFIASSLWGGSYRQATAAIPRGANAATFDQNPASTGYAVGDWVRVIATVSGPGTTMSDRYSKPGPFVVYTSALQHFGRLFFAKITAIDGASRTVTFDRTFPHDLYLDEAPQMREGPMLEGCGVQDLEIQTLDATVQLDSVNFMQVAESWMKNVVVSNARDWPYLMESVTRFELRDCQFLGTWADIDAGSNAYLGFTGNTDSLMINCSAGDLRHMAIFQMANRSVVSGCTFAGGSVQSPQLHGRFPLENLIEASTFSTDRADASAFAVDPAHTLRHGPNGPRNVFYNNRVLRGGGNLNLLGAQENLILAYNQILKTDDSQRLPPIWAIDRTFDAILRDNVIQAGSATPLINFEDDTNLGWQVTGNRVYGSNRHLWSGDSAPAFAHDNRFFPSGATPSVPSPEAPSLLAWQKANANTPRLVLVIDERALADTGASTSATVVRIKASTTSSLTVNLSASAPGLAFPASVTIPAGAVSAAFPLSGADVASEQSVVLTASAVGLLADTETISVLDQASPQPDFGLGRMNAHSAGLPAGWRTRDFGPVSVPGSATYRSATGVWTITGGGRETFTTDGTLARSGRRFAYQTIDGDGEIRARITSVAADRQTGLMIADDESNVTEFIAVTPDGRVLSSGYNAGDHAKPAQYAAAGAKTVPVWLRLKRVGAVFTAYRSTVASPASESDWTVLATIDFYQDNTTSGETDYKSQSTLDARMHYGLFINSGSETLPASATYTGVQTAGTVIPNPEDAATDQPLEIVAANASSFQTGNTVANALDGNLATRWAADGDGQWIDLDLGSAKTVSSIKLAWFNGNTRRYTFDVLVGDGSVWTTALAGAQSSGLALALEHYAFAPATGRYVRVVGHGNTSSFPTWVSFHEVEIRGPVPVALPSAPAGLSATAGDAQVALSWSAVPGAASYVVRRGTVIGSYPTAFTGVSATNYTDTTAANGVTYHYVVAAVNAAGVGADSAPVSATPVATPPPAPVTVAQENFDAATVVWNGGSGWSGAWLRSGNTAQDTNSPYDGARSARLLTTGSITRSVDLSAGGAPVLHVAWRANSLETGESGLVEINDGSWKTLRVIAPADADNTWTTESYPLSGYNLVANFQVRFRVIGNATNDRLFIDAIKITR